MRRIYLNDGWIFYPVWNDTCIRTSVAAEGQKVRLPHTTALMPYNYGDCNDYEKVCGYVRMLPIPEAFAGKDLWLIFEGVGHTAEVFVNGQSVARHYCGYTAFQVNIAPYIRLGCENRIAVKADSRESQDIPPFGGVIDYMTYGGIYRDVYLEVRDPAHIEDVFIRTRNQRTGAGPLLLSGAARLLLSVRLSREAFAAAGGTPALDGYIQVSVFDTNDNCVGVTRQSLSRLQKKQTVLSENSAKAPKAQDFETNMSRTATLKLRFDQIHYWDVEQPVLYFAEVLLCRRGGKIIDERRVRFGFRDIDFREDGFYLNGRRLKLLGLNRHQSFPYIGYAAPRSMQRLDAELLKHELGVNAVRTSHYPQSQHFIDRCDELGLLVFTEIPGWEYVGSRRWQSIAVNNVREMITQYRNHPSIILWGVRVNESDDRDDLYIKTNQMARRMDPARFTGGVRCKKNSSFLEDVYTYNDFSYDGLGPALLAPKKAAGRSCPYVVSEHTGHMYPAKMFDDEAQRLEHALRHARVLEAAFADTSIAGSFGWCMFDYQTHEQFGSGDGICYHGVMDMFRNPKLAAALYASQGGRGVCELASSVAPGDYAGTRPGSLWIFTDCDCVKAYREDVFLGEFYPDRTYFLHLPHPPVEIPADVLYGKKRSWGFGAAAFYFDFIKNGRLCRRIVRRPAKKAYLDVWCSHTHLIEKDSYDMALLRIRAVDARGLLLPYYNEPVRIKASGPVKIVGPETISLKGGCFGTIVRTLGGSGAAKVTLFSGHMEPVEIYMNVSVK